jgi:Ca2+-binding EF-hand superfamily protein
MISVSGVHEDIRNFMRENSVSPEKVYRLIDDNKSGFISYDELAEWISKIAVRKYPPEVLNDYYKGFRQPLNLTNFVIRVSQ